MHNHTKLFKTSLIAALVVSSLSLQAADVPASVRLAETQKVVRGNGAEPASLDPAQAEGLAGMHIIRDLFEGLVIQDSNGNVIPGVAESWETQDNQTFVFHLRKDAKWSNGDPVLAQDFVYGLQRAVDPKLGSPNGWYLELTQIENISAVLKGEQPLEALGVRAVDEHTLEFKLTQPVPYFVAMTGHTSMMPLHQGNIDAQGDRWTRAGNMVSNGAYTLNKWVVNEQIELVKNKAYWDADKTVLEQVTFIPFENQTSAINRYRAGQLDITADVPSQMAPRLKEEMPEAYTSVPLLCTYYYIFNNSKPPFDDMRVRQAVSYSIMRDVITDGVTQTGNIPAYTFAHKYTAGFEATQPEYSNWSQAERNAKAKELLAEAGYGPDKPLDIKLLYNTSENNKSIAVAIASMLNQNLGAKVELENQEWKSYLVARRAGEFDILRASWCGDYNEASTFLTLLTSQSDGNFPQFKHSGYDTAIANALRATSEEQRHQFYDESETILAEQMPIAPIYYYMEARLVRPNVGGFPTNNVEGRIYSKDLYMIAQ